MAQTSTTRFPESAVLAEADVGASKSGELTIMGFSMMCAWHFIVLFTAMPAAGSGANAGRPLILQLSLFVSLALSYGFIARTASKLTSILFRKSRNNWNISNIAIGLVACATSVLVYLNPNAPLALQIAFYVMLGISEAFLMFPWLELPQAKNIKRGNYRNLTFNMGIGALVAVVVCNLQFPSNTIATCALPLVANIMLIASRKAGNGPKLNTARKTQQEGAKPASGIFTTNFHFAVVGAVFGICQGAFSNGIAPDGNITFVANNMVPLVGAAISAPILFFLPAKYLKSYGAFFIQRLSILIFTLGVFCYLYFSISKPLLPTKLAYWGDMSSQAIFLCGFNAFDFMFMILAFRWASQLDTEFSSFIGFNRLALYSGMAVGLLLGYGFVHLLASVPNIAIIVAGVATLILTISHLPFFDAFVPHTIASQQEAPRPEQAGEQPAQEQQEQSEGERASGIPWRERVDAIATEHSLSKREREVFSYLAKGRNAAFIHEELWISIHTVKTHMFNIYRKLDVHTIQEIIDMVDNYEAPKDQQGGSSQSPEKKGDL